MLILAGRLTDGLTGGLRGALSVSGGGPNAMADGGGTRSGAATAARTEEICFIKIAPMLAAEGKLRCARHGQIDRQTQHRQQDHVYALEEFLNYKET